MNQGKWVNNKLTPLAGHVARGAMSKDTIDNYGVSKDCFCGQTQSLLFLQTPNPLPSQGHSGSSGSRKMLEKAILLNLDELVNNKKTHWQTYDMQWVKS
jgi:hypothetical protein